MSEHDIAPQNLKNIPRPTRRGQARISRGWYITAHDESETGGWVEVVEGVDEAGQPVVLVRGSSQDGETMLTAAQWRALVSLRPHGWRP
jgi:hypothetical protein